MNRSHSSEATTSRTDPVPRLRSGLRKLFSRRDSTNRFDLEQYLRGRKRSPLESRFHETVQKASHNRLSVEDVQRMCNSLHSKVEVMRVLLAQLDLKTQGETDRFTHLFGRLWQNTPRADLDGATPAEHQKKEADQPHAATVGRNDPCPCGSGKKHKRCCG